MEGLGLLEHRLGAADVEERLLRNVVQLTVSQSLEALDRFRDRGVDTLDAGELLTDEEGLLREARLSRSLGFEGKYVIHPNQIGPVNQAFRPSEEEVAQAKRIDDAFKAAEAQGFASTSLDGKMIDIPQAQRSRKLLEIAQSIAQREKGTNLS